MLLYQYIHAKSQKDWDTILMEKNMSIFIKEQSCSIYLLVNICHL